MNVQVTIKRVLFAGLLLAWLTLEVFYCGVHGGRHAEQQERLTDLGCEQIASKPELWECDHDKHVEVKP